MARKDKPYLPLYVQDFMTDERLRECSASSTGVYIMVMCVMHKSEDYGTILLKQKDKQSDKQILNFASKLLKHLPFNLEIIGSALEELIHEKCLFIDGDLLYQKRMVDDAKLSATRATAGSEGGKTTQKKKNKFALAKDEANSDIDINNIIIDSLNGSFTEKAKTEILGTVAEMYEIWQKANPLYPKDTNKDYHALLQLAYKIAEAKGWEKSQVISAKKFDVLKSWDKIVVFIMKDTWLSTKPLTTILTQWQRVFQEMQVVSPLEKLEKERVNPEDYFEK